MSSSASSPILHTPAMVFVGKWAGMVPVAATILHRLGMNEDELIQVFHLGEYVDRLPEGLLIQPEDLDFSLQAFGDSVIPPTNIVLDVEPLSPMLEAISKFNRVLMDKTGARTFLDDVYWNRVKTHPAVKTKTSFSDWLPDPAPSIKALMPFFEALPDWKPEKLSPSYSPRPRGYEL